MSWSHRTTTARLGMLAAIGAAFVITGCTAAPAPATAPTAPSAVPAAPSVAPSALSAVSSPVAEAPVAPPAPDLVAQAPGSPAASDAVAREAGLLTRGTATCIWNGSSDDLKVAVEDSDTDQAEYTNTSGTVAFPRGTWRCMKGDAATASGAPMATVTVVSGESFTVQSYNPPYGGCSPWVAVNGDNRCIETIGGTTDFKIDKHPIKGKRTDDTGSFSDGGWITFEVLISG